MTYDEFLSAAVVLAIASGYDPRKGGSIGVINRAIEALLGPVWCADELRMAVRNAAGEANGHPVWTEKGRKAYEEITRGST